MQILKIKTSAILAAIGIGMGILLCAMLLVFFPVLETNMTVFLLMLNIIMMAGNLFLFHFLVVFASNLENTATAKAIKKTTTKKATTKSVAKKTVTKKAPTKKKTAKKTTKKAATKKITATKAKKTTAKKTTATKKRTKK